MKIVGSGVDLVEVPRFAKAIERWGERMLQRLFTPGELLYAERHRASAQRLAARFAAKEAVVKALGAPKGLGLQWQDLEITHASSGRPQVTFSGTMERWKDCEVHLSLTHTNDHAIATAFILAK